MRHPEPKEFAMNRVFIVDIIRTGLVKAHRGTFKLTRAAGLFETC